MNKCCGVYMIRCIVTDKRYIGSSIDVANRWAHHRQLLRIGKHRSPYLQRAWDKYGPDAFEFSILETTDAEHLLEREQHWMDKSGCLAPENGYNLVPKAGNTRGHKHSEEYRRRKSEASKGVINVGSKSGLAKLNEEQVAAIKARLVQGNTILAIAKDYGVCFQTIGMIRSGKTWTHVPCQELTAERKAELFRQQSVGESNPSVKLKVADVIEIRRLLTEGRTGTSIAKQFGVTHRLVYEIKNGHVWKDLLPAT